MNELNSDLEIRLSYEQRSKLQTLRYKYFYDTLPKIKKAKEALEKLREQKIPSIKDVIDLPKGTKLYIHSDCGLYAMVYAGRGGQDGSDDFWYCIFCERDV